MFHKALWKRDYKQGKIIVWLLWGASLWSLPVVYANEATRIVESLERGWIQTYLFHFSYDSSLFFLAALTIALACLLLGNERRNGNMDFLLAMPFKRKDIFLSKWLFGAVNITGITLVNLVLMFIIQQTTIHGDYQTFLPFLQFFLYMFLHLLAIYSFALFIGTITGNMISQAALTIIGCILPVGLHGLITETIRLHVPNIHTHLLWGASDFFTDISIYSFRWYSFEYGQLEETAAVTLQQFDVPSLTVYIALFIYIVTAFLLGLRLFHQNPIEHNGKILVYLKLEPIFIWCTVICVALYGGILGPVFFWNTPLLSFYIGVILFGTISYLILKKVMKQRDIKFSR